MSHTWIGVGLGKESDMLGIDARTLLAKLLPGM